MPVGRLKEAFCQNCQTCRVSRRGLWELWRKQIGWWLLFRVDSIGLIWDLGGGDLVTTLIKLLYYKVNFSL